jgi:putative lipoprotein
VAFAAARRDNPPEAAGKKDRTTMTMRAFLAAAALLATAGAASAAEAVIRGQATPAEGYELEPGTTLEVELLDASDAGAESGALGTLSVPVRRVGPVPFVLRYDPATIGAGGSYTVSARLVQDRMAIQEGASPVLTGGAGDTASIALSALAEPEPVASSGDSAELVGSWTLRGLSGQAATAPGVQSTLNLTAAGAAQGRGGCNSFHATYSLEGGTFRFGPIAATRRACPPPQTEQETRYFAALEATRSYRIEGGALVLLDEAGASIARLSR